MGWYFRKRFQISDTDTFPQILARDILKFPIPNPDKALKRAVELAVEKLLDDRTIRPDSDTSEAEAHIDSLVYTLYGLTPEEIAIVEGRGAIH